MENNNMESGQKPWRTYKFVKLLLQQDFFIYKSFCFFIYGAFGALYPYLPLYLKLFKLSSFQAGTAIGIRPLIQIFGAPFWMTIGEWFRKKKFILLLGIFSWLLKGLVIMLIWPKKQMCIEALYSPTSNITTFRRTNLWKLDEYESKFLSYIGPPLNPNYNLPKNQDEESVFAADAGEIFLYKPLIEFLVLPAQDTKFRANPALSNEENKIQTQYLKWVKTEESIPVITSVKQRYSRKYNADVTFITLVSQVEIQSLFIIILLVIIVGEFMESPTFALSDSSMLHLLGENRGRYGQIRLWGAVGWAFSTTLVGYLIYRGRFLLCGVTTGYYRVSFYVYIGFVCHAFLSACGFKFNKTKTGEGPELFRALSALASVKHASFLVAVFYTGACNGFLFHFVNWYIDDRKGSSLIMGVAGATREIGEFTFFFLGDTIVGLLGNVHTMGICLLLYSACFYMYSVISSPWLAVPLECLDGAIYSLVWSNCVHYMSQIGSNIGLVATMQGILQAVFYGLGNGSGTIAGGFLYHYVGAATTFHYLAAGSLVTLGLLLLLYPLGDTRTTASWNVNTLTTPQVPPQGEQ
ncbi:major facilitator superfamily domain-containing protein 6 [Nematostella vectensis]|uniref:major facilitator superfamily domain-containing protein 6 n=1 Tax=Nematostella vectensis TaxID=45351 RepID=UPI0020771367|nr:major facilitator superfamily domain-containing protein 6 [Nematostella vectensis]